MLHLSDDATLTSLKFEIPWDICFGGKNMYALISFAMTLRKENRQWKLVSVMDQFSTRGQSFEELLKQMEGSGK